MDLYLTLRFLCFNFDIENPVGLNINQK